MIVDRMLYGDPSDKEKKAIAYDLPVRVEIPEEIENLSKEQNQDLVTSYVYITMFRQLYEKIAKLEKAVGTYEEPKEFIPAPLMTQQPVQEVPVELEKVEGDVVDG